MTVPGRGQLLSGGQRSSIEVFGSFSTSTQALLAETAFGLMAVIVSVRQAWLRQQHPTDSVPSTVTHTMGGFARDVAERFSPGGLTYSHIAHMEALLRADRFFGVSLLLLQQTEVSFVAAFILAGGVATTFQLFTHEWLRNPVRVAAAQEARRLAGRASAAASDARASALDVRSNRTDRPDGMGMNIAGGYQQVQKDAAALDISADDLVRAKRGDAGFFGGRASVTASDTRASALDVRSSRTDRPDGMGMNVAGGYEQLQQDAAALDISADGRGLSAVTQGFWGPGPSMQPAKPGPAPWTCAPAGRISLTGWE